MPKSIASVSSTFLHLERTAPIDSSINPIVAANISKTKPILRCNLGFFIDTSESTLSTFCRDVIKKTILEAEISFVNQLASGIESEFVSWNSNAQCLDNLVNVCTNSGTETFKVLQRSDVIVMLTDGEIPAKSVHGFFNQMCKFGDHLKGAICVIMIKDRVENPFDLNISVLMPLMLSDSLLIGLKGSDIYLLWSGGFFARQFKTLPITKTTQWSDLEIMTMDDLRDSQINFVDENSHNDLRSRGYISFGGGNYFDCQNFLKLKPTMFEFINLPLDKIRIFFKTNGQIEKLFIWMSNQFDRLITTNIFLPLKESMKNPQIFKNNRDTLIAIRYGHSLKNIPQYKDTQIAEFVEVIVKYLGILSSDLEESSDVSFTSGNLSGIIGNPFPKSDYKYVNFTKPFLWYDTYRNLNSSIKTPLSNCSICAVKSIPFILIKYPFDNTDINPDYCYDYPLCCACSDYYCAIGEDPSGHDCVAALPLHALNDIHGLKHYYRQQLINLIENADKTICPTKLNIMIKNFFGNLSGKFSEDPQVLCAIYYTEKELY
jgi:hypothetical protein